MIGQAFGWWIVVQLFSLATLPIALSVFQALPGRGYAFAKPFGLLLGGYLYWLALSSHVLPNRPGSVAWVLILLAVVSAIVIARRKHVLIEQARANLAFIVAVEVVFTASFFTAGYLRSFIPDIAGTEKPMDFMLLNTSGRSRFYPPADPWLAGFDVSYYYFGYVIQAMIGKLAYLPTSVTFNLGLASTVALTATATFGLGYELASLARRVTFKMACVVGLSALVLVTILGNLEGAVEFGIANGYDLPIERIDIANLDSAQESTACIVSFFGGCIEYPNEESSFWWWWRATRISPDANSITEFPFFSFLLGDLHPHVMALPFVLTVVGLGMGLVATGEGLTPGFWRRRPDLLLVAAVLLGGLGFLNTWDLPTFAFLLSLLVLARNLALSRKANQAFGDSVRFMAPLILLAVVLYVPFYLSFSSQADGLEAVRNGGTRPLHSFLFWAPLVCTCLPLPIVLLWRERAALPAAGVRLALGLPALLVLLWLVLLAYNGNSPGEAISARGWNWLTTVAFIFSLSASIVALFRTVQSRRDGSPASVAPVSVTSPEVKALTSLPFSDGPSFRDVALVPVLAMMSTAFLLILGAELFYIRDVFGSRLNTVFKLYYQAWLLLAISGACSIYWLVGQWHPVGRVGQLAQSAWAATASVVLAAAMLYPLSATLSRTEGLGKPGRTLDGLAFVRKSEADDWAATNWLRERADAGQRLVEATGGQYSNAGRIAARTGVATLMGWAGHEVQWGRTQADLGTRATDVDRIYTSTSLGEAIAILQEYDVTYLIVGSVERAKYPAGGLEKFAALPPAFQSGSTAIYRVPRALDDSAASR